MTALPKTILIALAASAPLGHAAIAFDETFESSAVGAFPGEPWRDIGTSAVPSPALPSGRVIQTVGPDGQSTRAFQVYRRDTTSQGLIREIAPAATHRVEADIRVDLHPSPVAFGDWTAAMGFFDERGPSIDINAEPQAVVYVYAQRWYFYGATSPQNFTNVPLSAPNVAAGEWYSVSLEADTVAGAFHVRVLDQSGQVRVDRVVGIRGYTPALGEYNRVAVFDGEYAPSAVASGQFTVDNIRYVPAPGPLGVAAAGTLQK